MNASSIETVVCLHEDRLTHFPGIQFAIASLHRHSPELKIAVSFPNSSSEADKWIEQQHGVERIYLDHGTGKGWNIKPDLILMLLERGHSQVIWLDADIIVNGPILSELTTQSENMLISTEEPYWGQQQGNDLRTRAWALVPFRTLSATVNTGVIRVTKNHLHLIKDWQLLLGHPVYLAMQKLPDMQRPIHMLGDQEVLTALLGGKKYGHMPVRLLRRGVEIAQCFGAGGFGVSERLKNTFLRRSPQLIHAMGRKPWSRSVAPPQIFFGGGKLKSRINSYYEYLMLESSPYLVVARSIKGEDISDSVWLFRHSSGGKFLANIGFNSVNLTGLPLAVIDSCGKFLKRIFKISRFSTDEKFFLKKYPLD
ncbi:hypothetical protein IMCC9480_1876 [Oxalobacteraceae bacterium IMCC9480]|nr:hypothetical protein IMCC9480_1876 [Oxalobacteraceae bacterium IMCC9480]